MKKHRIAIVGGGISGLSCAYALRNTPDVEITLYEKEPRLGGHSHTIEFTPKGHTNSFWIDTGFLVYNEKTYPQLIQFFKELNVPVAPSEMSFSVSIPKEDGSNLEWAGDNLQTLFAQKRNLLSPRFLKMLVDILRFNKLGKKMAKSTSQATSSQSVEDFLNHYHFGSAFRDWYLLPMIGAIWSCSLHDMLGFPIHTLMHFCDNHGLLNIVNRPQWMTVRGGSREYVERVRQSLHDSQIQIVHSAVKSVTRNHELANPIHLELHGGQVAHVDHIVFACHTDEIKGLLQDATVNESFILDAIPYKKNLAFVHEDTSLLPSLKSVWAAWNYSSSTPINAGIDAANSVCVHYLLNKLQPIPVDLKNTPVIVSLNPHTVPAVELTHRVIEYAHPLFTENSIEAQKRLASIQGNQHSWYCGAWTGYGFHEDGFKSGLAVAQQLINHMQSIASRE